MGILKPVSAREKGSRSASSGIKSSIEEVLPSVWPVDQEKTTETGPFCGCGRTVMTVQTILLVWLLWEYVKLPRLASAGDAPVFNDVREQDTSSVAPARAAIVVCLIVLSQLLNFWSIILSGEAGMGGTTVEKQRTRKLESSGISASRDKHKIKRDHEMPGQGKSKQSSQFPSLSERNARRKSFEYVEPAMANRQLVPDIAPCRTHDSLCQISSLCGLRDLGTSRQGQVVAIRVSQCFILCSRPFMCDARPLAACLRCDYKRQPFDKSQATTSRVDRVLELLERGFAIAAVPKGPNGVNPSGSSRVSAKASIPATVEPEGRGGGSSGQLPAPEPREDTAQRFFVGTERQEANSPDGTGDSMLSATGSDSDAQHSLNGTRRRARKTAGDDFLLRHAAASGLRFASSASLPIIGQLLGIFVAVVFDVVVSPGRGIPKATVIWIMWPLVAPFDFERLLLPWFLLALAYSAWVLLVFLVASASRDAWPFGRRDIDILPQEHRYSFTSPLGLNGLGTTLEMLTIAQPIAYVVVLGLEQEYLRWMAAKARRELRLSVASARRQEDVVVEAVTEQVAPFAQECMQSDVHAFEARPVVMAVSCVHGQEDKSHADQEKDASRSCCTGEASMGSILSPGTDGQSSIVGNASNASIQLEQKAARRVREQAVTLCGILDNPASDVPRLPVSTFGRRKAGPTVSRGFLQWLAGEYQRANASSTETSVGAGALGVLNEVSRKALFCLKDSSWNVVGRHLTVDKMHVHQVGGSKLGAAQSQWIATAGLRTPTRSADPLQRGTRKAVSAFASLAALEHFFGGVSRARKVGVLLRGGLSLPSSSQTAMVLGLVGLQQQPHEWATFGGGQAEAEEQARLAASADSTKGGHRDVKQSRENPPSSGCHVVCTSLESARRLVGVMKSVKVAVDAAVQWHLAMATDSRVSRGDVILSTVSNANAAGRRRSSSGKKSMLATQQERVQAQKDQNQISESKSVVGARLGQAQALQSSLQFLLAWVSQAMAAGAAMGPDATRSSGSVGAVEGRLDGSRDSRQRSLSKVQALGNQAGCSKQNVRLTAPCFVELPRSDGSTRRLVTADEILSAIRQTCNAARQPLPRQELPSCESSTATLTNGYNSSVVQPHWLSRVLRQHVKREETQLPSKGGATADLTVSCHGDTIEHELGTISAAMLPGLDDKDRSMAGAVGMASTPQRGLVIRSGLLMGLLGLTAAMAGIIIPIQIISMEIAAGQQTIDSSGYIMLACVPSAPQVICSIVLMAVGFGAHRNGQLLDPTMSTVLYGVTTAAGILHRVLVMLEVVHESCMARKPSFTTASIILVAVQFIHGMMLHFPRSNVVVAFGVFLSFWMPLGPYIILQALLEGRGVRTQSDAAATCRQVWGDQEEAEGTDRIRIAGLFLIFFGGLFALHFLLIQVVSGADLRRAFEAVQLTARNVARVLRETKQQLQAAASTVMPRAVILYRLQMQNDLDRLRKASVRRGLLHQGGFSRANRVLQMSQQHSGGRQGVARVDLGHSVVATVHLCGYSCIADLAGPSASLGLHRRVGAEVDAVCSKYGAIRVRGAKGQFCNGWFESQREGWTASQKPTASVSCSTCPSQREGRGWKCRSLCGSIDLLLRVKKALGSMSIQLRPVVGVADGRVSAIWTGNGPAQIMYADSNSGNFGAIAGSKQIAYELEKAGRGSAFSIEEATVGLSRTMQRSIVDLTPKLGIYFGKMLIKGVTNTRNNSGSALSSSLQIALLAWRQYAHMVSARDSQQIAFGPAPSLLPPVLSLRCKIATHDGQSNHGVRMVGNFSDAYPFIRSWQQDWLRRLGVGLTGTPGDEEAVAIRRWLHEWLNLGISHQKDSGTPGKLHPDTSLMLNDGTSLTIAPSSSLSEGGSSPGISLHLLVQPGSRTLYTSKSIPGGQDDNHIPGESVGATDGIPRSHMQDYRRLKLLGEGGFARVYLAQHTASGHQVALKVSRRNRIQGALAKGAQDLVSFSAGNSGQRASFKADVVRGELSALLRCGVQGVPGACRLEGVVVGQSEVGIVLELIHGSSLASLLAQSGVRMRLSLKAVRVVARQLACTLFQLHRAGVLHRDIKPSNIMIDRLGNARLVDFGLASILSQSAKSGHCKSTAAQTETSWQPAATDADDDLHLVLPMLAPLQEPQFVEQLQAGVQVGATRQGMASTILLVDVDEGGSKVFGDARIAKREQLQAIARKLETASEGLVGEVQMCVSVAHSTEEMSVMLRDEPTLYDCVLGVSRTTSQSLASDAASSSLSPFSGLEALERAVTAVVQGQSRSKRAGSGNHSGTGGSASGVVSGAGAVGKPPDMNPGGASTPVVAAISVADASELRICRSGSAVDVVSDVSCLVSQDSATTDLLAERILPLVEACRLRRERIDLRRVEAYQHKLDNVPVVTVASHSYVLQATAGIPEYSTATLSPKRMALASSTSLWGTTTARQSSDAAQVDRTSSLVGLADHGNTHEAFLQHQEPLASATTSRKRTGSRIGITHDFWKSGGRAAEDSPMATALHSKWASSNSTKGKKESSAVLDWAKRVALAGKDESLLPPPAVGAGAPSTTGAKRTRDPLAGSTDASHLYREQQAFVAGIAGTPLFMAPELFKHQGQRASDYWSLGVTLFWLLAGRMPFEGSTREQQMRAAQQGKVSWHLLPVDLSGECLDVLRGLLEVRVKRRYDESVLAGHPWLLPDSPSKRAQLERMPANGSQDVLEARWGLDDPFEDPTGGCLDEKDDTTDLSATGKAPQHRAADRPEAGEAGTSELGTGRKGQSMPRSIRLEHVERPSQEDRGRAHGTERSSSSAGPHRSDRNVKGQNDERLLKPRGAPAPLHDPRACLAAVPRREQTLGRAPEIELQAQKPDWKPRNSRRGSRASRRILDRQRAQVRESMQTAALAMYYRRRQVLFRLVNVIRGQLGLVHGDRRREAAMLDLKRAGMKPGLVLGELIRCENEGMMRMRLKRAREATKVGIDDAKGSQGDSACAGGLPGAIGAAGGGGGIDTVGALGDGRHSGARRAMMPYYKAPHAAAASAFGMGIASLPSVAESDEGSVGTMDRGSMSSEDDNSD